MYSNAQCYLYMASMERPEELGRFTLARGMSRTPTRVRMQNLTLFSALQRAADDAIP